MKKKTKASTAVLSQITDDEIRDYAFHLYENSGCIPGHDIDNWLEAKARLESGISKHHTPARHRKPEADADAVSVLTLDAEGIPIAEQPQPVGQRVHESMILLGAPAP